MPLILNDDFHLVGPPSSLSNDRHGRKHDDCTMNVFAAAPTEEEEEEEGGEALGRLI